MSLRERNLALYGTVSDRPRLDWNWVDQQLEGAGTYWVVAPTPGHPHPRPVWGVWIDEKLQLSVGSPRLRTCLTNGTPVTVHLDSGSDVVIIEGHARLGPTDAGALAAYDRKYDWKYDLDAYGPLIVVLPEKVLAWRSAGPAGRDGFASTGCWVSTEPATGQTAVRPHPSFPEPDR